MRDFVDNQAFPATREFQMNGITCYEKVLGMTLRDYFAGQALIGLVGEVTRIADFRITAEQAYMLADEMLQARTFV